MMTLNLSDGVLFWWFSLFVNKLHVSNLFLVAFNLAGNLFVLPRLLHEIEFN